MSLALHKPQTRNVFSFAHFVYLFRGFLQRRQVRPTFYLNFILSVCFRKAQCFSQCSGLPNFESLSVSKLCDVYMLFLTNGPMHAVRIGIKIVTLACIAGPRKNGRTRFPLAPTTSKRLLRRLCYPGVYSSLKKTEVLIVLVKNCERASLKFNFVISLEAYGIILLPELVNQ